MHTFLQPRALQLQTPQVWCLFHGVIPPPGDRVGTLTGIVCVLGVRERHCCQVGRRKFIPSVKGRPMWMRAVIPGCSGFLQG